MWSFRGLLVREGEHGKERITVGTDHRSLVTLDHIANERVVNLELLVKRRSELLEKAPSNPRCR